jgi:hypothetical protein
MSVHLRCRRSPERLCLKHLRSGPFSVDQITLSDGGTFGPRFREAQGFRCFGGAASAKLFVERCPTAFTLDEGPGDRAVGSLTWAARFLTLAPRSLELCGIGLVTAAIALESALNDREFGHGQTAAIGSISSSGRSFSLRIAAWIRLKQRNDRGGTR